MFHVELCQSNKSIEEKRQILSKFLTSIEDEEKEKATLMESIQELKEELARKSRSKLHRKKLNECAVQK